LDSSFNGNIILSHPSNPTNPFTIFANNSGYNSAGINNDVGLLFGQGPTYTGTTGMVLGPYNSSTSGLRISPNGNVSIGPNSLLINGNAKYTLDLGSGAINIGTLYQGGSPYVGSQWTNSSGSIYYLGGNVGIGSATAPAFTLDVNGNIRATVQITATTFNALSDYRIKSNVFPLLNQTIDLLKPIEYDLHNGSHDMGFLAHEVQEVFPFLVTGEKDGEQKQSMNYNGFIALLVKEVQDLKKENKALKERMDRFEERFM
jgi:hypothetical protein